MNQSIRLQAFIAFIDEEGNVQKTWSDVAQIAGTLIPTANVIWSKATGIIDNVDFEFYTKVKNAKIIKGNRFVVNSEPIYIEKTLDYGKILVVGLNNALQGGK